MHELRRSVRVQFPGSEGRLLAGIVDLPADPPKAFALFAHCFTCSKDLKAIVRISRRLAEHGWGVLRFDFAGLGGSEGPFESTNFSTNLIDLKAAVDFLSSEYEPPRILIGHSFGGAASLASAESLPSILGAVALAAPSDTIHLANLLEKMDPRIATEGLGEVTIGGRTHRILKQMTTDFRSHDLPSFISNLSKPVLILHSPVDETVGFHHAMRIYSLLTQRNDSQPPPADASLVSLQKSDHLLLDPHDIEFAADTIHVWFKRLYVNRGVV